MRLKLKYVTQKDGRENLSPSKIKLPVHATAAEFSTKFLAYCKQALVRENTTGLVIYRKDIRRWFIVNLYVNKSLAKRMFRAFLDDLQSSNDYEVDRVKPNYLGIKSSKKAYLITLREPEHLPLTLTAE